MVLGYSKVNPQGSGRQKEQELPRRPRERPAVKSIRHQRSFRRHPSSQEEPPRRPRERHAVKSIRQQRSHGRYPSSLEELPRRPRERPAVKSTRHQRSYHRYPSNYFAGYVAERKAPQKPKHTHAGDRANRNAICPDYPERRRRIPSIAPRKVTRGIRLVTRGLKVVSIAPKAGTRGLRFVTRGPRVVSIAPRVVARAPKVVSIAPREQQHRGHRAPIRETHRQPPPRPTRRYEEPPRRPLDEPGLHVWTSYREIRHLGTGGQGECYLVERISDGKKFVRKVSHSFAKRGGKPLEVRILNDVLGPQQRTIKLVEYAMLGKELITIYDFYPGGDLVSHIPEPGVKQSERFIWWIFLQLADVVAYLHQGYDYKHPNRYIRDWKTVIHCDIKPDNIFLREHSKDTLFPAMVLGDFGIATLAPGEHNGGTTRYLSPEYKNSGNTKKSDIWALGATIHEMIHGFPPEDWRPESLPNSFSDELDQLMMACLRKDPRKRISSRQLIHAVSDKCGSIDIF